MSRAWGVGLGLATLLLTTSLASAPAAATAVARPDLRAALNEVVRTGASSAIAEVRDERGIWRGASGIEQMGKRRPAPVDGRFRAGSITKSFVATVALQLVGEGKLRLDDTVERWLPGLVPNGAGITVRQLLNHTSGLFNYTDLLPQDNEEILRLRFEYLSPYELLAMATAQPPNFPPGQSWSYSNTNYIVVGLIIQKVTGHPYADEVRSRIVRPLGLHNTFLPGRSPNIPGPHAHGYLPIVRGGEVIWKDISRFNPSWAWAAGEVISTTADLNTFYTALFGGRLLSPALLAAMRTTVPVGEGFGYGLGVFYQDLPCGVTVWGHDGGIPGYATFSSHSADGRTHLTLSVTPVLPSVDQGIFNMIGTVFCGAAPAASPARTARLPLMPSYRGKL